MKQKAKKFRYVLYCECGAKTRRYLTEAKFKTLNGMVCGACYKGKLKEFQTIKRFRLKTDAPKQITMFDIKNFNE